MSGLMALESSCAPNADPEGRIENMYESGIDLSPPSSQTLSEADPPYSSIGSYPPPVFSPARFPPPPNSGFPQNYHLTMTFFEGQPAPHHSFEHPTPEPRAPYDHWPERSVSSGYGLDSSSKFVSHWPLPSANYSDNSKYGTMTSEPLYPTIATSPQYHLSDSRSKPLVSRFSSSVEDYHSSLSPVPSTSSASASASVSSPHFSSSSPQTARPHFSSCFSFNPHASAFYPGMYSQTSYGPSEDFSPYYEPSYLSHLAPTDFLSNSHQGVDSFHDASSRPVHSPETAPRPISSTVPSFFSGVHSVSGSSATFSNPVVAPQPVSSRTDYCGLTSSSDGLGGRESSCDFPPVSSLSVEMPVRRASVVTSYDTTANIPLSGQLKSPEGEEDNLMERILKESGTLLYHQHISPEEWRWNIYEAQYDALSVEGLVDLADCTSRRYHSTYNYFQGVDRIGPSCVNEAVGGDSNSLFALSILERSKFQNQGGPSLKLAASALAEMLATSSTGQSMMAHIASFPRTAPSLPVDVTFPIIGDSVEALQLPRSEEKSPDDCCSSSGSVAVVKEADDPSTPEEPTVDDPHVSSCIPSEREQGTADCKRVDLTKPDASDQSQNFTAAPALTTLLFNTVPQVGANPGHRSLVDDASASSTGPSLENVTSKNPNPLFSQTLDVFPDADSGMRVSTQPLGAVFSEDGASVACPLRASVTTIAASTSGPCHDVSSSRVEIHVPLSAGQNFNSPRNSVFTTGISPTLSQAHADARLASVPTTADEVAAVLASFNLLGPQTVNTVQTVPTHYSGLQLLTTSISNLTKVLLASHSSALPQSDISPIQESLQGSILGLSECLLLEQAKVNRQPVASNCVGPSGLKDSAGQEKVPADDSLEICDLKCQGEARDNSDRNHMKPSEGGPSEEARPRSDSTGVDISGVNVGDDITSLEAAGSQKTLVLRNNINDFTKYFQVGGSAKSGRSDSTISTTSTTNTFQLQRGAMDEILDYLRQQNLVNLPALKKFLAAEEREEKLKVLIQDLREQLEFEREESRGTAFLYEKILQEADMQTCKLQERPISPVSRKVEGISIDTQSCLTLTSRTATVPRPAQPSTIGTTNGTADHLECVDGMGGRPECLRRAIWNEDTDNPIFKSRNKEDCNRMEIDAAEVKRPSIEQEYSNLDGVEARLALLRGRHCRNMEEVLTGTGSFSPDSPGPSDRNRVREDANGSSSLGLHDEELAEDRVLSRVISQSLKQREVLFNMDAAWNMSYDYVGSQYEGMESREMEGTETQSHSVTQAHDSGLTPEIRAFIIRSISRWVENDGVDSGDEIFAGGLDSGSLHGDSGISGFSKSEDNRFDAIHDGSDTYLGILVNTDSGHRQQAVARNTSPKPERENEVECLLDSLRYDTEAVKNIIQSQDSEEESGWEHVRLPRHISK